MRRGLSGGGSAAAARTNGPSLRHHPAHVSARGPRAEKGRQRPSSGPFSGATSTDFAGIRSPSPSAFITASFALQTTVEASAGRQARATNACSASVSQSARNAASRSSTRSRSTPRRVPRGPSAATATPWLCESESADSAGRPRTKASGAPDGDATTSHSPSRAARPARTSALLAAQRPRSQSPRRFGTARRARTARSAPVSHSSPRGSSSCRAASQATAVSGRSVPSPSPSPARGRRRGRGAAPGPGGCGRASRRRAPAGRCGCRRTRRPPGRASRTVPP